MKKFFAKKHATLLLMYISIPQAVKHKAYLTTNVILFKPLSLQIHKSKISMYIQIAA